MYFKNTKISNKIIISKISLVDLQTIMIVQEIDVKGIQSKTLYKTSLDV